jgi:multidrug transporter EmrE-like cation transporter
MNTPVSSMAWVMFGAVIGSLGAAGLKAGAERLEISVRGVVTNWRLIAGLSGYLLSTVFFIHGVKNGELSILYPMVSVGYICGMLWSKLFFGEPITRMKIGALALILVGVAVLGYGGMK